MKNLLIALIIAIGAQYVFATNITINNQEEWDDYIASVANVIPSTDTINISSTIYNIGTFTNCGSITGSGTIGNDGTINNTGTITIHFIYNLGVINSCSPIDKIYNRTTYNLGFIPINTICDDLDPNTVNDAIREVNNCSSCAGLLLPPPAPIPTLSEWGLILLGMSLSIFGMVGIRQRMLDAECQGNDILKSI